MKRATDRTPAQELALQAVLLRIKVTPEFEPFRAFLRDELQDAVAATVNLNEDRPMHLAQGHARAFGKIIELIESSRDALVKRSGAGGSRSL